MATEYKTTKALDGKTFTVTRVREGPARVIYPIGDVTIYGILDGEPFLHTFGPVSQAAYVALEYKDYVPFEATLTVQGRRVIFQPLTDKS